MTFTKTYAISRMEKGASLVGSVLGPALAVLGVSFWLMSYAATHAWQVGASQMGYFWQSVGEYPYFVQAIWPALTSFWQTSALTLVMLVLGLGGAYLTFSDFKRRKWVRGAFRLALSMLAVAFVIFAMSSSVVLAASPTSGPIGQSVDTGYGTSCSASLCVFTNTVSGTQYYYAMVGLGYSSGSSCALTAGCQVGQIAYGGPGNAGGATGTNAASVINDAVSGGGQVTIGIGNFPLTSAVTPASNTRLTGISQSQTVLQVSNNVAGIEAIGGLGSSTTLSTEASEGATSLSVASISGFSANQYVYITDTAGPNNPSLVLIDRVTGTPSGTTINLAWSLPYAMSATYTTVSPLITNKGNISISDMTLQGVAGYTGFGIHPAYDTYFTIDHVTFSSLNNNGVDAYNDGASFGLVVKNSVFAQTSSNGINSANCNECTFGGNSFQPGASASYSISGLNLVDGVVLGNSQSGGNDLVEFTGSISSVFSSNTVQGGDNDGIFIGELSSIPFYPIVYNIISANHIAGITGNNVNIGSNANDSSPIKGNSVIGNTLGQTGSAPLIVYDASYTAITGNFLFNSTGQGGLMVTGHSSYSTVCDNTIVNTYYGLEVDAATTNTLFCNNNLKSGPNTNTLVKFTTLGSGVIFSGNSGYNPVATSSVTAGASVWTYTNNDGYDEVMQLSTAGGISAETCNGVSGWSITVGTSSCTLPPGGTMVVTWATTAPVYEKVPLFA